MAAVRRYFALFVREELLKKLLGQG